MVKGGGRSWKTVWKSVWKKFGCVEDSVGKNGLWRTDFSRRPRENPKNVPQYFIIPIDESSPTEASPLPSTLKPFPRESKGPKKSGLRTRIIFSNYELLIKWTNCTQKHIRRTTNSGLPDASPTPGSWAPHPSYLMLLQLQEVRPRVHRPLPELLLTPSSQPAEIEQFEE